MDPEGLFGAARWEVWGAVIFLLKIAYYGEFWELFLSCHRQKNTVEFSSRNSDLVDVEQVRLLLGSSCSGYAARVVYCIFLSKIAVTRSQRVLMHAEYR